MFASSQLAQDAIRRVREELSDTNAAQDEFVGAGTLLYRIIFPGTPVTVGLHQVVRDQLYAFTIFDGKTGRLVLNEVWMLGHEGESAHFAFCPVRRELTSSFHYCDDCSAAKRSG